MTRYVKLLNEEMKYRYLMGFNKCTDMVGEEDGIILYKYDMYHKWLQDGGKVMRYVCDVEVDGGFEDLSDERRVARNVMLRNMRSIGDDICERFGYSLEGRDGEEIVRMFGESGLDPYCFDSILAPIVRSDMKLVKCLRSEQIVGLLCVEVVRYGERSFSDLIGDYELEKVGELMEVGEISEECLNLVNRLKRRRNFVYW